MSDPLARVHQRIADALAELRPLFRGDVQMTLLVRMLDSPDADLIVSSDDMAEVAKAVERLAQRPPARPDVQPRTARDELRDIIKGGF